MTQASWPRHSSPLHMPYPDPPTPGPFVPTVLEVLRQVQLQGCLTASSPRRLHIHELHIQTSLAARKPKRTNSPFSLCSLARKALPLPLFS